MHEAGAALLFWDYEDNAEQLFKKIQHVPAVAGIFRNHYWVTFYAGGKAAFVDQMPLLPAPHAQATEYTRPSHYGVRNGAREFFWSPATLEMQCNRIEQFANCAFCRHASDLGECLEVNAVRWARKNGFRASDVRVPNDAFKSSVVYDPSELEATLRYQCSNINLDFVSPGIIAGPFSTKLMFLNEINLNGVEGSIEDIKNRGTEAHSTRAAVRRCQEECYFYRSCNLCEKPYFGYPSKCQAGEAYGREGAAGPFSEYEVMESVRREVASWDTRSREEVAVIAHAAGVATKIFGKELLLSKMNKHLKNVEFFHERSGDVLTYTYEDAVEIIQAKYYSDGRYVSTGIDVENTPPMSDDDYLVYAELCQIQQIHTGGWGCSQPASYVEWRPGRPSDFYVGVRLGGGRSAHTLLRAAEIGQRYSERCALFSRKNVMAVRGEAGPETTKDTLL